MGLIRENPSMTPTPDTFAPEKKVTGILLHQSSKDVVSVADEENEDSRMISSQKEQGESLKLKMNPHNFDQKNTSGSPSTRKQEGNLLLKNFHAYRNRNSCPKSSEDRQDVKSPKFGSYQQNFNGLRPSHKTWTTKTLTPEKLLKINHKSIVLSTENESKEGNHQNSPSQCIAFSPTDKGITCEDKFALKQYQSLKDFTQSIKTENFEKPTSVLPLTSAKEQSDEEGNAGEILDQDIFAISDICKSLGKLDIKKDHSSTRVTREQEENSTSQEPVVLERGPDRKGVTPAKQTAPYPIRSSKSSTSSATQQRCSTGLWASGWSNTLTNNLSSESRENPKQNYMHKCGGGIQTAPPPSNTISQLNLSGFCLDPFSTEENYDTLNEDHLPTLDELEFMIQEQLASPSTSSAASSDCSAQISTVFDVNTSNVPSFAAGRTNIQSCGIPPNQPSNASMNANVNMLLVQSTEPNTSYSASLCQKSNEIFSTHNQGISSSSTANTDYSSAVSFPQTHATAVDELNPLGQSVTSLSTKNAQPIQRPVPPGQFTFSDAAYGSDANYQQLYSSAASTVNDVQISDYNTYGNSNQTHTFPTSTNTEVPSNENSSLNYTTETSYCTLSGNNEVLGSPSSATQNDAVPGSQSLPNFNETFHSNVLHQKTCNMPRTVENNCHIQSSTTHFPQQEGTKNIENLPLSSTPTSGQFSDELNLSYVDLQNYLLSDSYSYDLDGYSQNITTLTVDNIVVSPVSNEVLSRKCSDSLELIPTSLNSSSETYPYEQSGYEVVQSGNVKASTEEATPQQSFPNSFMQLTPESSPASERVMTPPSALSNLSTSPSNSVTEPWSPSSDSAYSTSPQYSFVMTPPSLTENSPRDDRDFELELVEEVLRDAQAKPSHIQNPPVQTNTDLSVTDSSDIFIGKPHQESNILIRSSDSNDTQLILIPSILNNTTIGLIPQAIHVPIQEKKKSLKPLLPKPPVSVNSVQNTQRTYEPFQKRCVTVSRSNDRIPNPSSFRQSFHNRVKKECIISEIEKHFKDLLLESETAFHVDRNGNTRLHQALISGNLEQSYAVQQFWFKHYKAKIDHTGYINMINHQNVNGQTALHIALARGIVNFSGFLIQTGADAMIRDRRGNTVFHHAVRSPKPRELVKMLYDNHQELLNEQNADGETPLFLAVDRRDIDPKVKEALIEILLLKGSKVDIQNKEGKTVLHLAVLLKDKNLLVKLIIGGDNSKAALQIRDTQGHTVLHLVALLEHVTTEFRCEMALTLLSHEANPTIADNNGIYPYELVDTDCTTLRNLLKTMLTSRGWIDMKEAIR